MPVGRSLIMHTRRLAVGAIAASVFLASSIAAQQPGTVELGGYGSYTRFGDEASAESRGGTGGRIGIFVTPRLSLEGEAGYTYTDFTGSTGGRIWYSPLSLRAVWHVPAGSRAALLLGAGVTRGHFYYADESYDAGPSALAGVRLSLTDWLALRVDGVADWMLDPRTLHLGARSGLSLLARAPQREAEAGASMSIDAAPTAGTVELGAFGLWSKLDTGLGGEDGIGAGGRLGVFVTPRILIEGELSSTTVDSAAGAGSFRYAPLALRALYHVPVSRAAFVLGAGGVRSDYYSLYDYGVSGLVGVRLPVTRGLGVRVDGIVDYLPDPKLTNLGVRAGVSWRVRLHEPPRARPAPAPPAPEPARPVVDSAAIRDSLDRLALERARADSIAAAEELRRVAEEARNTLRATISFGFDQAVLSAEARARLDAKLVILRANPRMRIRIVGHADDRGSDEYNLALGQRRAAAAKRYLVQRGIEERRFETVSRGEEEPVCRERTQSCWSRNRRDEFLILIGEDTIVVPEKK
jgi:peptidoglycan-associated lipoprotein